MLIKSFRDIRTPEDVSAWLAHLGQEWPEREAVMRHICEQVKALPFPALDLVELGTGPGHLARLLLAELPQLSYTGIDSSTLLLAYARQQVAPFGRRADLVETDLNQAGWPARLPGPVQAIISMQSMHDLGGEAEIDRVYSLARSLLVPGGLFLNADLVAPAFNPAKPGRLTLARHLALLAGHGYRQVACTLEAGEFACLAAWAP